MKHISMFFALALTLMATSCTNSKEQSVADNNSHAQDVVVNADIKGQWYLENIVLNDTVNVRPSEVAPEAEQYIVFEDSTYSIITNCNSISGSYTLVGDSIILGAGPMTEKACENMATEDALRNILPNIATVSVENDSVARLGGSNPSEYIELCKATK